jgi:hypothetical protein
MLETQKRRAHAQLAFNPMEASDGSLDFLQLADRK